MGRDSLSLFSGSANGIKPSDSDRRNDRAGPDLDAVQGNPIPLGTESWLAECRNPRYTNVASACRTHPNRL